MDRCCIILYQLIPLIDTCIIHSFNSFPSMSDYVPFPPHAYLMTAAAIAAIPPEPVLFTHTHRKTLPKPCNYCGVPTLYQEYHLENECPSRRVPCPDCNRWVTLSVLKWHLEELCPARLVRCRECEAEMSALVLPEHQCSTE
jgi:hypothetical protein